MTKDHEDTQPPTPQELRRVAVELAKRDLARLRDLLDQAEGDIALDGEYPNTTELTARIVSAALTLERHLADRDRYHQYRGWAGRGSDPGINTF